jgi:hypothetical protein
VVRWLPATLLVEQRPVEHDGHGRFVDLDDAGVELAAVFLVGQIELFGHDESIDTDEYGSVLRGVGRTTDARLTGYYDDGFESARMSRRHRRPGPSGSGIGANRLDSTEAVERASVVGSAPIIAGTGFVLSRAVAIVLAGASGLTFLWGLVIGLAFATAGVVVFASTETDSRPGRPARRMERVPLTTAGGVLLLSLLTGVVLGTVL